MTNSKEHEVGILLVGGLGAVPPSQQLPAPPANAAALLEALDQAIKSADVPKLLDSVKEILAAPGGATALEPHRPKVLGLLITEAQQAIQLAGDPVRRLEAKQRLDALVVELTKLTRSAPAADSAQKSEEERCLAYVLEFTRQLAQSP